MRLRDSLINMLGEFVGLNKTPDFKLNVQSTKFIAEAVAAESRRYSLRKNSELMERDSAIRARTYSTNSANPQHEYVNMDPSFRRLSEPSVPEPQSTMSFMPKFANRRKQPSQSSEGDDNGPRSTICELTNTRTKVF
uniref:Uncharacterized protein n=1 Tax=Parascaris univalens TaxID=6257 RepID=A0A914ZS47_PARUN